MLRSILVAGGSRVYRKTLRPLLEKRCGGAICGEAGDGADAIEQAMQLRPDLIVLDFAMPGLNGLEAAGRLKQLQPGVPILMLTSFGDGFLAELAYKAGVAAVVSKADARALENCVRVLLKYGSSARSGTSSPETIEANSTR